MPKLLPAFLSALLSVPAVAASQTATAAKSLSDQTVAVSRGARLSVHNHAGEVIVRGWDRDAVRVQGRHGPKTRIAVKTVATGVQVSSPTDSAPGFVDYQIDAPKWMAVRVKGDFIYIGIEGTESEVSAETIRGDVVIKGGGGFVEGKSVEGDVKVSGARGRIAVNSINQGVLVDSCSGDIVAETVNGPIKLTSIGGGNVDASTVNGHVTYEGAVAAQGKYRFSSHNGNIVVTIPESSSAVFSVRTYNGTLNTTLPLQRGGEVGRGRRATYTLGSGSAEFELESFGGTIHLRRQGAPATRSKDKD